MRDINNVLNSLRDIVQDKFSDMDNNVEIKIFPGLKVSSRYIPLEHSNCNLRNINTNKSGYMLYLNGEFSNRFKNEIKIKHNSYR